MKRSASKLPPKMVRTVKTYVELGIWEEKTLRKVDNKWMSTCYYVEASCRNRPGRKPTRPTKSGRAPNLVEARKLRDQLRVQLDEEVNGKKPLTLSEYFQESWYPEIARRRCKAAAYDVSCSFNGNVIPAFGEIRLVDITTRDLDDFVNEDLKGVSPPTKRKYRKLLNNFFKAALRDGHIAINPVPAMEPIKGGSGRTKSYLTMPQLRKLLGFMRENEHPYFIHAAVAALTGLRVNEQRGLQWQDVDFDRGLIHVRRVLNRMDEGFKPFPKDDEHRPVPLNPQLREILSCQAAMVKPKPEELVLPPLRKWVTGEQGEVLDSLLILLELPRITWYQFRHSFAAALADLNVPVKTISEVLGHSKIETTCHYLVNLGATVRGAADKLKLLDGPTIKEILEAPLEKADPEEVQAAVNKKKLA